jgi:acyl-CoA dehydrogenase
LPLLNWSIQDALYHLQQAFDGLLNNFPNRLAAWVLRALIFPLGKTYSPPSDDLGHMVAMLMLEPGDARDRLTAGIYIPSSSNEPIGILEKALRCATQCEITESKVRAAVKSGLISAQGDEKITEALERGIITAIEAESLTEMKSLRRQVIMVDDFPSDFGTQK